MPQNDDRLNKPRRNDEDEPLDFGAFVSSNVQRTSDLLKGESGTPPDSTPPRPDRPDGERPIDRARDKSYWRRKAAGVGVAQDDVFEGELPPPQQRSGRNRYLPPNDEEIDQFHDENEFGEHGGGFGGFFADFFSGDGDDGNRNRIIAAIVALIILLLIIVGLTRIFSDNGDSDDDTEITPVPTEVIDMQSTPADDPTDLTEEVEVPQETEEPEIPRGGDNQRGEGEGEPPPEANATEVVAAELTSEIARACTGFCLVRMEGQNQQAALESAGARASWAEDDTSWVVVTPQQAEELQRDHALTFIENDPLTYNLYIVKAPAEHNQRDVIEPHGTIIDQTGRYYLVRWNSVPAVVKPVIDWGYAVWKIAPAPPEFIAESPSNGPAISANGWAMMEQVDEERVERLVTDLAHIGELDNSGLGTRYYTQPGNQIAADYLYQELESYGLTVWYEDFIMWDGYLLVNVIAEIPGQDSSEVYALMAHFDSTSLDNPRVAPGADDNASGLAVTLEVARILSGYDLEHPVRIALVNAEEEGLYGADSWAKNIRKNGVNVVGVFNIDSVGSVRNRPYMMTNADEDSAWMQQHLSSINSTYQLHETIDHFQRDGIVADDDYVRDQGIPAILVARELFGANDVHHTLNDVPSNVSMGGVADTCNIILLVIWDLVK